MDGSRGLFKRISKCTFPTALTRSVIDPFALTRTYTSSCDHPWIFILCQLRRPGCLAYTSIFICHFRWVYVPHVSSAPFPRLVHTLDFLEHLKWQWMPTCERVKRGPRPRSSCVVSSRIFALQQDTNSMWASCDSCPWESQTARDTNDLGSWTDPSTSSMCNDATNSCLIIGSYTVHT